MLDLAVRSVFAAPVGVLRIGRPGRPVMHLVLDLGLDLVRTRDHLGDRVAQPAKARLDRRRDGHGALTNGGTRGPCFVIELRGRLDVRRAVVTMARGADASAVGLGRLDPPTGGGSGERLAVGSRARRRAATRRRARSLCARPLGVATPLTVFPDGDVTLLARLVVALFVLALVLRAFNHPALRARLARLGSVVLRLGVGPRSPPRRTCSAALHALLLALETRLIRLDLGLEHLLLNLADDELTLGLDQRGYALDPPAEHVLGRLLWRSRGRLGDDGGIEALVAHARATCAAVLDRRAPLGLEESRLAAGGDVELVVVEVATHEGVVIRIVATVAVARDRPPGRGTLEQWGRGRGSGSGSGADGGASAPDRYSGLDVALGLMRTLGARRRRAGATRLLARRGRRRARSRPGATRRVTFALLVDGAGGAG